MANDDILAYSEKIKRTTKEILEGTGLLDTLATFGTVHVIGSYAMDLLYHPDIDVIVETEDPRASSVGALNALVAGGCFEKIEYGDFVKFPRENRPNGYILVLRTTRENVRWEIEVWFVTNSKREEDDVCRMCVLLTPELRRTILEFKRCVCEKKISKHEISSADIYHAVLIDHVTDFEEFIKHKL